MNKTHKLVRYSLFIALVCLGTIFLKIHVPATNGYINIGDAFIIILSLMFGPIAGMISGAIGSAMADALSGYAHFAVFTLVIKAFEGFIIGWLFIKFNKTKKSGFISSFIGLLWMVSGYFMVETFMFSDYRIALQSLPFNVIQAVVALSLGYPLYLYVSKINKFQ